MRFNLKKTVIAGKGISGKGAFDLAKAKGYCPEYYSDENSLKDAELVVVSPGFPTDHEIFTYCRSRNIPIIGEIEFGYGFCTKPVIAVTGTNGKTTTVKLLGEIFRAAGINAIECGNIGRAFCDVVNEDNFQAFILEISSFQLQTIVDFRPDIAVILNIGEDHIDRHKTRNDYASAKLNIAKNMNIKDKLILGGNIECGILRDFIPSCEVYFFDVENSFGIYRKDKKIYFGGQYICDENSIRMSGEHNIQNAMAAIIAAKLFGISTKSITYALENFTPPRHRIEYVDTVGGIRFYNDSKGTNIDATLAAIRAIEGNICLLLGGSDKGEDFSRLFLSMDKKVNFVIAMGDNKTKIYTAAKECGFDRIELTDGLADAINSAIKKQCDTILLSPASASFDKYSGYAQRGEHFVSLIKELKR